MNYNLRTWFLFHLQFTILLFLESIGGIEYARIVAGHLTDAPTAVVPASVRRRPTVRRPTTAINLFISIFMYL